MTLNTKATWEAIEPHLDAAHHKYIVLHHTAGPAGQTVEDIDAEHKAQGWAGVGYHRLVYNNGTIHEGRPDDVMGAQAKGLNAWSIGVCAVGTFTSLLPPDVQYKALVNCLAVECERWNIPVENIIGHRDVAGIANDPADATSCPGDALYAHLPTLRADVIRYL
jgi:hypothetical protein